MQTANDEATLLTLNHRLDDVAVRIHGEAAYVTALGTWRRKDGSTGQTRYIDSYVITDDAWRVVSAQLTRVGALT